MAERTRASKKAAKKTVNRPARRASKADGESEVLAVYAAMTESDRSLGEKLHVIV